MTSQVIYPHIEKTNNDDPAHLKRVPRVRVAQIVMDYLAYGWSVEEMNRQHPYLTLGELHAAMAYYFDHQEEKEFFPSYPRKLIFCNYLLIMMNFLW